MSLRIEKARPFEPGFFTSDRYSQLGKKFNL